MPAAALGSGARAPVCLGASNWRGQMSESKCPPLGWDRESETCVPVVPAPGPSAGVRACKCYQVSSWTSCQVGGVVGDI